MREAGAADPQALAREDPEKGGRDRGQRGEQPLRVELGAEGVRPEGRAIDPCGEVALGVERPRGEQGPVRHEQRRGAPGGAARPRGEVDRSGEEDADADALEHSRNPVVLPVEGEESDQVEKQSEHDENPGADHGLAQERVDAGSRREPAAQRQGHRDADREKEKREDRVGVRPSVPLGVLELRVDG